MQAIVVDQPGDENAMRVGEVEAPEMRPGCIRIRVAAAGVNRADLLQRQGHYPPPPGASEIIGLECAGEVIELAPDVSDWRVGERAMALLAGGGYAQEVVVSAGSAMRVPNGLDYHQAAGLPEVFLTVFLNVFQLAALPDAGSVLVHGGGSGIGTATIQLVKAVGGRCIVTAGTAEKCDRCLSLGASRAVNYREDDFAAAVAEETDGRGVDVVLDHIGGSYLGKNLASLAVGGRMVVIGLMGGTKGELPMGLLLAKRLQIMGSTLRARPDEEKAQIVSGLVERFYRDFEKGTIAPVIDRVLPLAEAPEAHRIIKSSTHFGKIVLAVNA